MQGGELRTHQLRRNERLVHMRLSAFCALTAVLALAACGGGHKSTVYTSSGNATVTTSDDNKTVQVESKEGTYKAGKDAVDLSKLAVPLYPGATQNEDSGGYAMSGKEGSAQVVVLTTGDSFDKVYAWYKAQLPKGAEKMKVASGGTDMAQFATGDKTNDQSSVMIESKNGKTQILISHQEKK